MRSRADKIKRARVKREKRDKIIYVITAGICSSLLVAWMLWGFGYI